MIFQRGKRGFTLVEVILALGLFTFAIIPLIGLMGQGVVISGDSIQTANLAEIHRHAARKVAGSPTSTSLPPMYFTYSGEETNALSSIYTLTFSNVDSASASDASAGLLAKKIWNLRVARTANTNLALDVHFLLLNQDPVEALPR
jgi:prepilin-type N-terminal cleavage/methylation domain-containing protein